MSAPRCNIFRLYDISHFLKSQCVEERGPTMPEQSFFGDFSDSLSLRQWECGPFMEVSKFGVCPPLVETWRKKRRRKTGRSYLVLLCGKWWLCCLALGKPAHRGTPPMVVHPTSFNWRVSPRKLFTRPIMPSYGAALVRVLLSRWVRAHDFLNGCVCPPPTR